MTFLGLALLLLAALSAGPSQPPGRALVFATLACWAFIGDLAPHFLS